MSRVKSRKGRRQVRVGEAASRVVVQVYHTGHTHGSRERLYFCTHPSPSSLPRCREPGARAMPPLTGVGERCAPRATWSCIDEPLKPPGRSRSASLPTPVKGRFSRHRLLRAPGMSHMAAPRPSLKLHTVNPFEIWTHYALPASSLCYILVGINATSCS